MLLAKYSSLGVAAELRSEVVVCITGTIAAEL
jgi:hypothetical protein